LVLPLSGSSDGRTAGLGGELSQVWLVPPAGCWKSPSQVENPEREHAASEEEGLVEPVEHHPHPYADATCAHEAQLDEKSLQGSAAAAAHVLLLGDTHPADAEHVVDAAELDCWHAAEEDADELLPDEQYSEWTRRETHKKKRETE